MRPTPRRRARWEPDGRRHHATRRPREDVPPRRSSNRRLIAPVSTTSFASPRRTATPRQRSYSVASAPDGSNEFELTVERLDDGEVSTFLHDEVVVGDELEVRGPIGGWFVWDGDTPALLVGGGSGVVPLMAMLRLARRTGRSDLVQLVVSVRTRDDLFYARRDCRTRDDGRLHARRRPNPSAHRRGSRAPIFRHRIAPGAHAYICGSSGFADAASDVLMQTGIPAERIRVERFGPTG